MRYTLRDDSIHNIDDDASVFIQDEEGDRTTSLVGQTFSYDRRDDRFLPSGGYFLKLGPGSGRPGRRQSLHPA